MRHRWIGLPGAVEEAALELAGAAGDELDGDFEARVRVRVMSGLLLSSFRFFLGGLTLQLQIPGSLGRPRDDSTWEQRSAELPDIVHARALSYGARGSWLMMT